VTSAPPRPPYRGEPSEGAEPLLPRRGRLPEGLVSPDELLHLVHAAAQLLALQQGLLGRQPSVGHHRLLGELVHLQHCRTDGRGGGRARGGTSPRASRPRGGGGPDPLPERTPHHG